MATYTTIKTNSNLNLVSDYSKKFFRVAPTKFPTASFQMVKSGGPMDDIYVRWGEKTILQQSTQVNHGAGYNDSDATIVLDSTEGMRVGSLLFVPRTGEFMKVGAVDSSVQISSVTRGVLAETGGLAAALTDNETIEIMGTPPDEAFAYANAPSPLMYSPSDIYNEMQLFLEPVSISNRALELIKRGILKYKEQLSDKKADAMELVKLQLNRSLLFGMRATVAGSAGANTKTGGLKWHAQTNSGWTETSVGDITNAVTFENIVKNVCLWAGAPTMRMVCSPLTLQALQRLYQGGNLGYYGERTLTEIGVNVHRILTPWGTTLEAYLDFTCKDYYDNSAGAWKGQFFVFDPSVIKWRPNRALGLYEPPPTADSWTLYIMGEGGWELGPAKSILYATGVTAPSA